MTLIESREPALAVEVQPVLRSHPGSLSSSSQRGVVDRFRERVHQACGQPIMQPAAQLNLSGFPCGIAIRGQIGVAGGTYRTRVHGSSRIGVRQKLLLLTSSLDTKICRCHDQCSGKVALDDYVPVLRIADAEVR